MDYIQTVALFIKNRGCCYRTSVVFVSKVEKCKVNRIDYVRKRRIVFQLRYLNATLGELDFFLDLFHSVQT